HRPRDEPAARTPRILAQRARRGVGAGDGDERMMMSLLARTYECRTKRGKTKLHVTMDIDGYELGIRIKLDPGKCLALVDQRGWEAVGMLARLGDRHLDDVLAMMED